MKKSNSSLFFSVLIFVFFLTISIAPSMMSVEDPQQPTATAAADGGAATTHIVYMEQPEGENDTEAFHLHTLAHVVGSEEAAKEVLLYSYKHAACGFSAKLTPQQVEQLSKQAGVIQVVPSKTFQLHSSRGQHHAAGLL